MKAKRSPGLRAPMLGRRRRLSHHPHYYFAHLSPMRLVGLLLCSIYTT